MPQARTILTFTAALAVVAVAMTTSLRSSSSNAQSSPAPALPATTRGVTIMAYNIEGLPWPFAHERSAAFAAIEHRLQDLRRVGEQPHVLVLEEAFTPEARSIGRNSGYRSIAVGGSGTPFGSGLEVATDLPILDVKRFTYRRCAGFDCFASKGVLLTTVALPKGVRIQIAATHLNSHNASGADDSEANRAYFSQVDELSRFVRAKRDPKLPLLVVGDFNTYPAVRADFLMRESRGWQAGDALNVLGVGIGKGKDRQFFSPGAYSEVKPVGLSVPFGKDPDGTMLSNHIGYVVQYRLDPSGTASRKG